MSRNRGTVECDCGAYLGICDSFTRALNFREYLQITGVKKFWEYPYFDEYVDLIGCGVMCPRCFKLYLLWIGGNQFIKGHIHPVSGVKHEDRTEPITGFDTSYWENFNDEEAEP